VVGFTPQPPYPWDRADCSDWTEGRWGLTNGLDVSDKTLLFLPGSDNFSVIQLVSRINGVIPPLNLGDLSEIRFTHFCACRTAVRTYYIYIYIYRVSQEERT